LSGRTASRSVDGDTAVFGAAFADAGQANFFSAVVADGLAIEGG
jgi:hypothetical protein